MLDSSSDDLSNLFNHETGFGTSSTQWSHQARPSMPPYVPPCFSIPSGSGFPSYPIMSPVRPMELEALHLSRYPSGPFATTPPLGYLSQPQPITARTVQVLPAVDIGTVTNIPMGCTVTAPAPSNTRLSRRNMPPQRGSAVPAAALNPQASIHTRAATLPVGAGNPRGGPPIAWVLDEITLPYEIPVLSDSSCVFGEGVPLGNALKKNFSHGPADGTGRAFPSKDCSAKLAFWFVFDLGQEFPSRKKQVTVVTTRKNVINQPSKDRLAHLVAREMEKYMRECTARQIPFPYALEDVILLRIDLVSKGTVRPRISVHVR